jgi:hypothetical protein
MILPGETEAGTAGTQPCRGISRWAHRADTQHAGGSSPALLVDGRKSSDDRPSCLENPRPAGAVSTLTENVASPFQAEPRQYRQPIPLCSRAADTGQPTRTSLRLHHRKLKAMADWLKQRAIRTIALQSGVYWIAVYDILEEAEFEVYLVNCWLQRVFRRRIRQQLWGPIFLCR